MHRSLSISESDWKRFKKLRSLALDRFCRSTLGEARALCDGTDQPAHDRYRALFALIEERDKEIVALFDPHTRSRAILQLTGLCDWWLISEAELDILSDELQARVKSCVHEFGNPA